MPRGNRHYITGHVWHIIHWCHKEEFLLKFARNQRQWLRWPFEVKKRYGLSVLNYMVTCNHIHLLVRDNGKRSVFPSAMQLIAARAGQEYNSGDDIQTTSDVLWRPLALEKREKLSSSSHMAGLSLNLRCGGWLKWR